MTSAERRILLGIGSNIQRSRHIAMALDALNEEFGELEISRVFESEAVGVEGADNFYNLVVGFFSDIDISALSRWTKRLEAAAGRRPQDRREAPKQLDIDILCVGDWQGVIAGIDLPRKEILTNAFVLQPLAETFGEERHPTLALSYSALWENFRAAQALWPIDFCWKGCMISHADQPTRLKAPH